MKLLELLLIVLVVYVPNQLHFPADLGFKGLNVFNILLVLTIVVMLSTRARAPSPPPLRWPIGVFAVLLVLAFLLGQAHPAAVFPVDVMILKSLLTSLLLYFIFYYGARDPDRLRRLIIAILFVAFVAAVEAIREGISYGLGGYATTHRASGPFGEDWRNSNRAGVFYAMFLPMFLSLMLFRRRDRRMALAGLIGTVCTVFAIFVTYSRQAYLIAAVAILLLGLRRHIVAGVFVVTLVASWTLWAPQAAVDRMQMTYVQGEGGDEQLEESARSRLVIWQQAAQMILAHPLGVGLNRFHDELGSFGEGEVEQMDAHNSFVLMTAEAGVQGLLAFVVVLVGLMGLAVRLIRAARDDEARALAYGYAVSVVCLVLGNLYGSAFFSGEVMGNFWALSGLVARHRAPLLSATKGTRAPRTALKKLSAAAG